jgi:hypothetical protein
VSNPSETRIQEYILAQLSLEPGCAIWKYSDECGHVQVGDPHPVAIFWRQNTGAARTAGQVVRFGVVGQPDIAGVVRGRYIGIEVKTAKGRQSREQVSYESTIAVVGGVYVLARGLDDVLIAVRHLLAVVRT